MKLERIAIQQNLESKIRRNKFAAGGYADSPADIDVAELILISRF